MFINKYIVRDGKIYFCNNAIPYAIFFYHNIFFSFFSVYDFLAKWNLFF